MAPASEQRNAVLFDVDGTLVDTTYLHAVCWWQALIDHGHTVPMADIHHAIGMGSGELLTHLLGDGRDQSEDEGLTAAHMTLYRRHWGELRALPGAADLLRHCAESGLKVVLASSASAEELSALRDTLNADDAVADATTADDAEHTKPAPDVLNAALERTGLSADRAIFVGDAVWDGHAAAKADVRFLAVTCGGTPEQELRSSGAVDVFRDPAELLDRFDESDLGRLAKLA
jgi:HAD superfamily hydrolase (TIGR01549 family)